MNPVNANRLARAVTALCLSWTCLPLLAKEPVNKEEPKPSLVKARLSVTKSQCVLPEQRQRKAFGKLMEEATATDKLPGAPEVNLVLELKNIRQVDVR